MAKDQKLANESVRDKGRGVNRSARIRARGGGESKRVTVVMEIKSVGPAWREWQRDVGPTSARVPIRAVDSDW